MNGGKSYPTRPVNRELLAEEKVVFLGKLVGACLFEPVIERVGCKKTLYIGAVIQIIGIVRTSSIVDTPVYDMCSC